MKYCIRMAWGAGLLLALAALPVAAAEVQSVWVETDVNTGAVHLGEPFRFVLTAGARNAAVQLPGSANIWSGCRLLAYSESDVSQRHEGYTARQGQYTLAAFTLDQADIPEMAVRFAWPDGTTATAFSKKVRIQIISLHPSQGFELREPRPPQNPGPIWIYFAAFLVALVLLGLVWRIPRRIKNTPALPPPHLEAFHGLEALNRSRAVAEGRVDHYFTELSRVLRRYLGRRYHPLAAMELPRLKIIQALTALQVPLRARHLINSLLIRADLVKFAKIKVDFPQIAQAQRRAKIFIEKTRPLSEVNAGKQSKNRKGKRGV
jgi:hypothetical protein